MMRTGTRSTRGRRLLFAVMASLCALAAAGLVVQAATRTAKKRTAERNIKNSFQISGSIAGELRPGRKFPVKIVLASNKSYPLWITRLRITAVLSHEHRLAGCSIERDFRFTQIDTKAFPFRLNSRKYQLVKVKTSRGRVRKKKQAVFTTLPARIANGQPTIEMVYLPHINQDACKGAKVHFVFDARAERSLKRAKRRAGK